MQIAKNSVVTFKYDLKVDDEDDVIDSDELTSLIGHGQLPPGLEAGLLGLAVEATKLITVAPEEGYGERDEAKVIGIPRSALPEGMPIEIGMPLELEDEQGEPHMATIQGTEGDDVVLDLNHPLAGSTLHFDVVVTEVRAATAEELQHGHAHGPGGHHHH